MDDNVPHVIMTSKGTWNPRIVDDIETADKMMTQFPPTSIETTDLFYKDNGDIDDTYIRNNYQAHTIKSKSVWWNPVLTETNDGEPFIPLYKR